MKELDFDSFRVNKLRDFDMYFTRYYRDEDTPSFYMLFYNYKNMK